jgi:predicted  nucleic acid-binding Zn-ribbon protein
MRENLLHLVEVQTLDMRLANVEARLTGFPRQVAEANAQLEAVRARLRHAREELTRSLKDRKTYELDVEQWKEKVRKYKDQVYQVKSNDAYKALQHEIQMAEGEIARAEDRLLERMMAGEDFERQVKAAEKELAEAEAATKIKLEAIRAEHARAQQELTAIKSARAQAVAAVPEDLLDHYLRIARKHAGVGLSAVGDDETCSMCRVRIRPHTFQLLRDPNNSEVFHCETCTRILYYAGPSAVCADAARPAEVPQGNNA